MDHSDYPDRIFTSWGKLHQALERPLSQSPNIRPDQMVCLTRDIAPEPRDNPLYTVKVDMGMGWRLVLHNDTRWQLRYTTVYPLTD